MILAPAMSPPPAPTVLHVAPYGRDGWDGSRGRPLQTLEGARDRLRQLRAGGDGRRPVEIVLRGGVYRLSRPFVLEPGDSGRAGAPVVYRSARGETAVVSGALPIRGWSQSGNVWTAPLPSDLRGAGFRQLTVNGRLAQRAREPDQGFFQVDGDVENPWRWGPQGARLDRRPSTFRYRNEDVREDWAEGGEAVLLLVWAEARLPIAAIDTPSRTVTLADSVCPSNRETDARYWVEGTASCLDEPGEWHADPAAGTVRYLPAPGERPDRALVEAPRITELVRLQGDPDRGRTVEHVEFRGLRFEHADWRPGPAGYVDVQAAFDVPAAVTLIGARHCRFRLCSFRNIGPWSVEMGGGCADVRVTRCDFESLGAGAVKIGEYHLRSAREWRTSGNAVEDCRIRDIGRVCPAAPAVWIGQSGGNRVAHDLITDTCGTGISVGWTWGYGPSAAWGNVIERNRLHRIARGWLSDLGGVYLLGARAGTRVAGNHITEVRSRRGGGWGLYADEGTSRVLFEGNLVHGTTSAGFFQHYGFGNEVRRNILSASDEPNVLRHREEEHESFHFHHNVVLATGGLPLGGNWSNGRFRMDHNLYWSLKGQPLSFPAGDLGHWQRLGHDRGSIVGDPGFRNVAAGDFRLRDGSLAARLGVAPPEASGAVGPRPGPIGAAEATAKDAHNRRAAEAAPDGRHRR